MLTVDCVGVKRLIFSVVYRGEEVVRIYNRKIGHPWRMKVLGTHEKHEFSNVIDVLFL